MQLYYAIFIQGLESSQPYSGRKIHVLIKILKLAKDMGEDGLKYRGPSF